jgi:hypothetical protein
MRQFRHFLPEQLFDLGVLSFMGNDPFAVYSTLRRYVTRAGKFYRGEQKQFIQTPMFQGNIAFHGGNISTQSVRRHLEKLYAKKIVEPRETSGNMLLYVLGTRVARTEKHWEEKFWLDEALNSVEAKLNKAVEDKGFTPHGDACLYNQIAPKRRIALSHQLLEVRLTGTASEFADYEIKLSKRDLTRRQNSM